ncbi:hypothetical protein HaLaN_17955 [Haematococcus lacustris]|uniref:Uncharacterized protein n=1 Tax=Haematococcus lacustris TaxID=44745 RepID=A0A699ZDJ8_HAELA|nr:hypothetical protein HaLaN_17955 [Haematococcus lacustris]
MRRRGGKSPLAPCLASCCTPTRWAGEGAKGHFDTVGCRGGQASRGTAPHLILPPSQLIPRLPLMLKAPHAAPDSPPGLELAHAAHPNCCLPASSSLTQAAPDLPPGLEPVSTGLYTLHI